MPFSLFPRKNNNLFAAIEVDISAMRGVIFEQKTRGQPPTIIKKVVDPFPKTISPKGIGEGLHAFLYAFTKEMRQVPQRVVVGIGLGLAEHIVLSRTIRVDAHKQSINRASLKSLFHHAFSDCITKDSSYQMGVPLVLFANRYPLECHGSIFDAAPMLEHAVIREIGFRMLMLKMPRQIAEELRSVRRLWGGIPVQFVPSVLVYQEVMRHKFGFRDVLWIYAGEQQASAALMQKGALARFETFSYEAQESSSAKKQSSRVEKALKGWEMKFGHIASEFASAGPLPRDVALFGFENSMIRSMIQSGEWTERYSYVLQPSLRVLQAESVFDGDSLDGNFSGSREFGLASFIYWMQQNRSEQVPNDVLVHSGTKTAWQRK